MPNQPIELTEAQTQMLKQYQQLAEQANLAYRTSLEFLLAGREGKWQITPDLTRLELILEESPNEPTPSS